MDSDTEMGGPQAVFPATRSSIIKATAHPDPEVRKQAFADLVAVYWKPIYKYIRLKWSAGNEDAKDLTQAFFARAMEKGFFESYDPAKARFRTYLRICLDGHLANARKSAQRIKRGGQVGIRSLDFASAEGEWAEQDVPDTTDPEEFFHREWIRSLFLLAVEELRQVCEQAGKSAHFLLFERYDLQGADAGEKKTYAELGAEFGLPATQVTNYLAWARREFRRLVLERLRGATGSEAEFQEEAARILGGPLT